MKVLFLSKGKKPDYMCDMIYHGLKTTPGIQVDEYNPHHYMYKSFTGELYGKGFTMYRRLEGKPTEVSLWQMLSRIRSRHYDFVVFASIQRYNRFFKFISFFYSKEKLIAIDGEDDDSIDSRFTGKSTYYKRELTSSTESVLPITFCVPEELVLSSAPKKEKRVAHIVPGDLKTYIYSAEKPYYEDYQHSVFGITMKKAGWDCLRHYEILMNGCIPYFIDLDKCPAQTMTFFPKEIVSETNRFYESGQEFDHGHYVQVLLKHTREFLTTKQLVNQLFKI